MHRRKTIYSIMTGLTLAAYAWVGLHALTPGGGSVEVCMFKGLTDIPCPSCGITRSLLLLVDGQWSAALLLNPLGGVAALAMAVIPLWLGYDALTNRPTFARAYVNAEERIKRNRTIWIPLVVLLLCNWGWNIIKAL